jgi:hypothetical protein
MHSSSYTKVKQVFSSIEVAGRKMDGATAQRMWIRVGETKYMYVSLIIAP